MRAFDTSLRHDVPGTDYAWGASIQHFRRAANVRLGLFAIQNEKPLIASAFVEHKDFLGLTVRATVRNLIAADDYVDRIFYVGRRTGPIDFIEARVRNSGPTFALSVSGSRTAAPLGSADAKSPEPKGHAGSFSLAIAAIFSRQTSGAMWWTLAPSESTATVTGMSSTSNS